MLPPGCWQYRAERMGGLKPEGVQVCILQKPFANILREKCIHVLQCYAVTRHE